MFSDFSWSIGKIEKKDHVSLDKKKKKLKKRQPILGIFFVVNTHAKVPFFSTKNQIHHGKKFH